MLFTNCVKQINKFGVDLEAGVDLALVPAQGAGLHYKFCSKRHELLN